MIALSLLVASALLVLWCVTVVVRLRHRHGDRWEWAVFGIVVFSIVMFCLALLPSLMAMPKQIDDNRAIDKTVAVESVQRHKANELVPQFKSFLAEQYPQYEQQVFSQISSPEDVSLFFVRYPELKASEGLRDLVSRIDKLTSNIFDQQVKRQSLIAGARGRVANPWLLGFFLEDTHQSHGAPK